MASCEEVKLIGSQHKNRRILVFVALKLGKEERTNEAFSPIEQTGGNSMVLHREEDPPIVPFVGIKQEKALCFEQIERGPVFIAELLLHLFWGGRIPKGLKLVLDAPL
jgi:hypothetical protein